MAEAVAKTLEERIAELETRQSNIDKFFSGFFKVNKKIEVSFENYIKQIIENRSRSGSPVGPSSGSVLDTSVKAEQIGGKSTNLSKTNPSKTDEELEAKVGRKTKSSIPNAKRGSKPGSKKSSKKGSKRGSKKSSKKGKTTKK